MFAFACWDPRARRLLLARDPLGYQATLLSRARRIPNSGWSLAFASELRALLASGLLGTPRLAPQAVASSVWNGFVVGPGTAVEGRRTSLAGPPPRVRRRAASKSAKEDFWRISDRAPSPIHERGGSRGNPGGGAETSPRQRCARWRSSSPAASTRRSMANLAQRAAHGPIHTFTLAFEEQELNEGPIARQIARCDRNPAPRGRADGGGFRRQPRGGAGQPGSADLRRPQRLLHVSRHPRRRLHCGDVGHGRRRALRRLHHLPRPAGVASLVPSCRLAPRTCRPPWRPWRLGHCDDPAGQCRRRPAGPSSPIWSAMATIC